MEKKNEELLALSLSVIHANLEIVALLQEGEDEQEREVNRQRKRRTCWTRPWLLRRPLYGQYEKLLQEMRQEDVGSFRNFLRVEPGLFQELLERVGPLIEKKDTFWRKALEPGLKLAITLRFLATGNSYRTLQYGFRVASNTISCFVPEVCEAIIQAYSDEMLSCPITPEDWKKVALDFQEKWNLPHCIGALDGKHVAIKCPPKSGSVYYNYKGFFSIVLMALVDATYQFLHVEVGANGGNSDGGVFNMTDLKEALETDKLGLPPPEPLPNYGDKDVPYFIIGDEAFPLRNWLMKPIPQRNMSRHQRIYNYRLSRGRRVVENAFGLLASRFRCLLTTLPQSPEKVAKFVLTCCCLHNLIRKRYPNPTDGIVLDQEMVDTHDLILGTWRNDGNMHDLGQPTRGNVATQCAKEQRDYLVQYFNSPEGSVPWQEDMI